MTTTTYYRPTPGEDIGCWNVFPRTGRPSDITDVRHNVPFDELPEEVKDMLRERFGRMGA